MQAILAALYLQAGAAYMLPHGSPQSYGWEYWRFDITEVRNPYGSLEVGFETDQDRHLSGSLSFRHLSSMTRGQDFGQNTVEVRVKWKPFR